ncbi:unnamed protein product [Ilex paraguariensis]|uniref:Uncharacterized protein n=1 Tax=Ilex paraguariensis TaxID=185542 RepID=A0ABC8UJE2_9AQUA
MGGSSGRWQRQVYEKDVRFCSVCLKQGHDDSLCCKKGKEKESVNVGRVEVPLGLREKEKGKKPMSGNESDIFVKAKSISMAQNTSKQLKDFKKKEVEQTNKFSVLNMVEEEGPVMGDNFVSVDGERLSKFAELNVEKQGISAGEGVVFTVDPIHVAEEVIGEILDGIAEKVVEGGNLLSPDQSVGGVGFGELQSIPLGPVTQRDQTGSLDSAQGINRGLDPVCDLNVGDGQRSLQKGDSGNVDGSNEHCGFNKQFSSFYLERFAGKSGASVSIDDERGLIRHREPPDKGYYSDTGSTMKSKELMGRVVMDSEDSDSDSASVEFSSAEVEMRMETRGTAIASLHD